MLKKMFLCFSFCVLLLLTGCDGQKTITIENCQPDGLFLQALSTLKKEFPQTKINIDVPSRKVGYSNYKGTDYPSDVEMTFTKNKTNTDVLVAVKNADENNLNNIQALLTKSLNSYKITKEKLSNEDPIPQSLRIDSAK